MAQLTFVCILAVLALVTIVQSSEHPRARMDSVNLQRFLADDERDQRALRLSISHPRPDHSGHAPILTAAAPCTGDQTSTTVEIDTDSLYSFTSPNFPNRYTRSANCEWLFKAGEGYMLDLYCPFMSLKSSDFFDVADLDWNTIGFLEGVDSVSLYYYFWGNDVKIGFESNDKGEATGFQCYIWRLSLTAGVTP